MHRETNTKYKAPRDNVPAVGEEQAQPEGKVDESAAQHDEGIPIFDQAAAEAMLAGGTLITLMIIYYMCTALYIIIRINNINSSINNKMYINYY
jgi:hypothetical protein